MINLFRLLLSAACVCCLALAAVADQPAKHSATAATKQPVELVRLAIVDDSGSMSGARIKVVREELMTLIEQLPPTPQHPFVLVTFGTRANNGVVCTSPPAAKAALSKLQGDAGGTSIAAGLRQGYTDLQRWSAAENVVVILYTDFQDGDRTGIRQAEQQLDTWFGERSQTGKQQSVFVKQWGGQRKALLEILSQSKNVNYFRVGEVSTKPVTIDPKISVESVRRKGQTIEVQVIASGAARKKPSGTTQAELEFNCVASDMKGDRTLLVPVGSAKRGTLLFDAPDGGHDGEVVMPFVVALKRAATPIGATVLATSRLAVPVKIPATQIHYVVTATLEMNEPPRWVDPIGLVARYPVTLVFDVPPVDGDSRAGDSSFRITPRGSCRVAKGDTDFTVPGPGRYRVPLEIETAATNPGVPLQQLRFQIAVDIKPIRVPPNVHWQPAVLSIDRTNLAAPDPLVTLVQAEIASVDRRLWLNLDTSLVVVDATAVVTVSGLVPPGTTFSLSRPPGVHHLSVQPRALRPDRNCVKLRMVTPLEPHPKTASFSFRIVPTGNPKVGVELLARDPLRMAVTGPRKACLVITDGRAVVQTIQRTVLDNSQSLDFHVVPCMREIYSTAVTRDLRLKITCADKGFQLENKPLRLFQPQRVSIGLPRREMASFFRDESEQLSLWILPETPNPAIDPVCLRGEITRMAPFRRLLLYLSIAVCSVGAATLLVRLFVKLREPVQ